MAFNTNNPTDVFQTVTDRFIAALEKGVVPWQRTWSLDGTACISYGTGKPYSLLNTFLLDFQSGEFLTYREAEQAGGFVKRGEHGKMIVFWKMLPRLDENKQPELDIDGNPIMIPFLKRSTVFHISQCEGVKPKWTANSPVKHVKPDDAVDLMISDYLRRSGVKFNIRRSSEAYYDPANDTVVVPELEQFGGSYNLWAQVALHQLCHSSGHSSRLNRFKTTMIFGDKDYSQEELVAEMGSAFLMNFCGLETEGTFKNSAAYIQSWLKELRNDKKLIVVAASRAEKAASLIIGEDGEAVES